MIENKNEANRNLEKALQALEQAKQRVANEKKKRMRRNGKLRTTTSISWAVANALERRGKTEDIMHIVKEDCGGNTKTMKKIYTGLTFLCGTIAGIWSFSANRFRYDEMILIIGAGMIIGLCLAVVCHNILIYLKK